MYKFDIVTAASLGDAATAIARDDARLLAGGQTLIASMKLRLARPQLLVDLGRVPGLTDIRREGDRLVIGAMVKHARVADSPEVRAAIPALAALAGGIGDRMVRNMGTLGGSIANNDPAADYPAAVLALGATVITDRRRIPADDFFVDMFQTALEPQEIITAVEFPLARRAAYAKFRNPASRYAIVGVFVADMADGVRVAVTGARACVFRCEAIEQALAVRFAPDAARAVRVPAQGMNSDLHATPEYRAHLVSVMAARAVESALRGA